MTLKHAKTSAKADGADATQVQPSDWNADHVIDADGVTMATRTDNPAAPAAGKLVLFGKTVGGGALPAFIGPSGISSPLQPLIGRNKVGFWIPPGNGNAVTQWGIAFTPIGTAAARNVATTNLFSSMRRHGYTTGTGASGRAMVYSGPQFFLSAQPGVGGFRFVARFGISDATFVSGAVLFAGFAASSTVANGANPSASLNIIGVGADATDTTLQIMSNDGTGTATKTDLGANFPANTANTDMYELALFAASGGGASVGWQVTRLNTGDTATGAITTDLPTVDATLLDPIIVRGNLSTGLVAALDIAGIYVETDN